MVFVWTTLKFVVKKSINIGNITTMLTTIPNKDTCKGISVLRTFNVLLSVIPPKAKDNTKPKLNSSKFHSYLYELI